eukprot:GGOE01018755.1.p1 GENE.GGOE01018755.1~~GGOE01018755.1.p1  ORF type:complete len:556 (-),score=119.46 GGOE01018755.1:116-1783(-)
MSADITSRPLRQRFQWLIGLITLGFMCWLLAPYIQSLGRRMDSAEMQPLQAVLQKPHNTLSAFDPLLSRTTRAPDKEALPMEVVTIHPNTPPTGTEVEGSFSNAHQPAASRNLSLPAEDDVSGVDKFANKSAAEAGGDVTALPLVRGSHLTTLLASNVAGSSARTVDMWALAQRQAFRALGCEGHAMCPGLTPCSHSRYMCTHNPLNITVPPEFPLKEFYPEAFLDTSVFVLPNALQEWNGNIVGLQKGGRPTHYLLGMCPWGNINVARAEVLSMTLHVPRAASLIHVYAINFYHFLAETLPRYYPLLPLLRAYPDTRLIIAHKWGPLVDLFFPADHLSGRSINMKMWGAGKPKSKPRRDSKVYKYVFADQFFVTLQPKCGMPPMVALAEMRRDYLANVRSRLLGSGGLGDLGLILLYSRNNFTSRRALRENEQLYAALVSAFSADLVRFWYGIWPSRIQETAGPLAQASVLVGPHGAGLAAMLFLPPTGSVLELRQDHRHDPNSCFQAMAYGAGITFDFVFGRGNRDTPMSVNVTLVVERVKQLRASHWRPLAA